MAPRDGFDRALDDMISADPSLGQERGPVRRGRSGRQASQPYPTSDSAGSAPPKGSHAQLVEQIKDWQRASLRNTGEWQSFCDQHGDGSYDPTKYDEDFLRGALSELKSGGSSGSGLALAVRGRLSLTDQVKEWQRSSRSNTLAWRTYCISNGDGSYDPSQYDAAFLKAFLSRGKGGAKGGPRKGGPNACGSRGGAKGSGKGRGSGSSGGQLTELVKARQRASSENAEAWRHYCEEYGDGSYDPSSYSGSFLRSFLDGESLGAGRRPEGRRLEGRGGGPLTQQAKDFQRGSKENALAWAEYCDRHGDGVYDPGKHDASFLKKALRALSDG